MPRAHDPRYNRDEQQKAGSPPRMAQEPNSAKGSRTGKTRTDPASGETRRTGHPPNQAAADQTDGLRRR